MSILNIQMPDYKTRMDAFDALCKPEVPFPEDWRISWDKPERFTCHCCGFPTMMDYSYDMCLLCDWIEGNYSPDTNYSEMNTPYELFDSRKHFEENGSIFIQKDGYTDFERATKPHILEAKRKLIHTYLGFLQYAKGSAQALKAWQNILHLEIALENRTDGSNSMYSDVLKRLKWRNYPVAIKKLNTRYKYGAVAPDLPDCYIQSVFEEWDITLGAKVAVVEYIKLCLNEHREIPEPLTIEYYKNNPQFEGCTWIYVKVNQIPRLA